MNKLTALIEAAKADVENSDCEELSGYGDDVLELCSLLEKAEDALEVMARTTSCNYAGVPEALAAIKQWKEQT